jgi:CPA2 family monovalent cation:H+ antiporter-2
MHELTFLQDLAIVMAVSAAVMVLCKRVHLPVVLGYILAGMIIGPNTPPFPLITDIESIRTLSELGVIFLLFGIGLEFSLRKLLKVGGVSSLAATLEILLMIWLGYGLGRAFGWTFMDSLFLGAILSISSTTIIAKILLEMDRLHERFAQVILGILIVEDLLAIVIIAVLSGIASTGALTFQEAAGASIRVAGFVGGTLLIGLWLVPPLLRYVRRLQSDEMLIVTVLGLCFGVSLIAAKLGFSVALGAFLIGAIVAETRHVRDIVHRMEPIRDMFTAIFFVSVGMLLDPALLIRYAWPILAITLATIFGKVLSCSFATFLTGYEPTTSVRVGLGLAQIGEFSFIIARLGEATRVTSPFLYPIAVSVSGITTVTTPFLMRFSERIVAFLARHMPEPLVTAGSVYTSWLRRMTSPDLKTERQALTRRVLAKHVPRFFLYAVGALVMLVGAGVLIDRMPIPPVLEWAAAGLVVLPMLFGMALAVDRTVRELITGQFIGSNQQTDQSGQVRDVLHHVMRVVLVLICGLPLLLLGSFVVPLRSVTLGIFGLLAVSALVLWGSARRLHDRMERIVLSIFDPEAPQQGPQAQRVHDELVHLIQEEYPWEVDTQDFVLPYQESPVNQPIKHLRLRTHTGASIVAIYRGEETLVHPSPDIALLPGDVLLLMGSRAQIMAAITFLQQLMRGGAPDQAGKRPAQPRTQRVTITNGSLWTGKTLAEVDLTRLTGAHVVGIQHGERTITNPDEGIVIAPDSVLVLFGLDSQLEQAVVRLTGSAPP